MAAERVLRRLQVWETQPPGPCDKYNALSTRFMGWQTRRRECNAMPGCVFVGRSVTGFCVGEEDWAGVVEGDDEEEEESWLGGGEEDDEYDREFPSSSDPEGPMVETELLASLVTVIREEGIEQPVRLLITVRPVDSSRVASNHAHGLLAYLSPPPKSITAPHPIATIRGAWRRP